MATIHLIIEGKVQGVFYRATAKDVADAIGITGWIRNTDEGYVEAMATGTHQQVEKFIEWCKKGSSKSVVTNLRQIEVTPREYTGFTILRR